MHEPADEDAHAPPEDASVVEPSPAPAEGRRWHLPRAERTRRAAAACLTVLVLLTVGGAAFARSRRLPPDAALAVGDDVVTTDELERRTQVLQALYGVEPPSPVDEPDRLAQFRRDLAQAVSMALVIDDAAAREDVVVPEPVARQALDRFIAERYPQGGREAFVTALGVRGVSEADVLDEISRVLRIQRLFDRVTEDADGTPAEVEAYFREHRAELDQPERRRVRHLVVAAEPEAQAALGRIAGGEPFDAVARSVSLDGSTRAGGGDLGELRLADLDPPFGAAAFAAAPGQPFGPVRTELGWHVGVVEAVLPPQAADLEALRPALAERVELEDALERWRAWLRKEVGAARIRYAADFQPAEEPELTPLPGIPTGNEPRPSARPGAADPPGGEDPPSAPSGSPR